jgi:hypothetical protein
MCLAQTFLLGHTVDNIDLYMYIASYCLAASKIINIFEGVKDFFSSDPHPPIEYRY